MLPGVLRGTHSSLCEIQYFAQAFLALLSLQNCAGGFFFLDTVKHTCLAGVRQEKFSQNLLRVTQLFFCEVLDYVCLVTWTLMDNCVRMSVIVTPRLRRNLSQKHLTVVIVDNLCKTPM